MNIRNARFQFTITIFVGVLSLFLSYPESSYATPAYDSVQLSIDKFYPDSCRHPKFCFGDDNFSGSTGLIAIPIDDPTNVIGGISLGVRNFSRQSPNGKMIVGSEHYSKIYIIAPEYNLNMILPPACGNNSASWVRGVNNKGQALTETGDAPNWENSPYFIQSPLSSKIVNIPHEGGYWDPTLECEFAKDILNNGEVIIYSRDIPYDLESADWLTWSEKRRQLYPATKGYSKPFKVPDLPGWNCKIKGWDALKNNFDMNNNGKAMGIVTCENNANPTKGFYALGLWNEYRDFSAIYMGAKEEMTDLDIANYNDNNKAVITYKDPDNLHSTSAFVLDSTSMNYYNLEDYLPSDLQDKMIQDVLDIDNFDRILLEFLKLTPTYQIYYRYLLIPNP